MPRSTRPDMRGSTRACTRTSTGINTSISTNSGDSMRTFLIVSALAAGAIATASAQDFNWHGRIAAGKRLEEKGVNGDVRAVLASGGEAGANARMYASTSCPAEVQMQE